MTALRLLAAAHDGLTRLSAVLATLCLSGIVLLYCGEVVTRYFLDAPTSWSAAVSVYLLLATVMLMMPRLTSEAEHVSASIVDNMFPPEAARLLGIVIMAIACVICAISACFAFSEALGAYLRGTLTTDTLYIPKWWLLGLVFYGLASSSVHFARHTMTGLRAGARREVHT